MKLRILSPLVLLILSLGLTRATLEAQSQEETGELNVYVGKSLLINSPDTLQRVSVTNAEVAAATAITPNQVLIHGLKPGSVTLLLWDQQDRTRSFNLNVVFDVAAVREALRQTFPQDSITVSQSGTSLVLNGNVSGKPVSDQAAALAATFGGPVVNLLQITESQQMVLLQVKFAEVDRSAIQQYGVNFFSTGVGNTPATVSTQHFGSVTLNGNVTGQIPGSLEGTSTSFGLADLLNIFVFRPDLNLGATIKALQQKSALQILAEPNVMAINGKEASFLAGGEFPIPIVQSAAAVGAVTVQFREFGVRLNFTPTILSDGTIHLKVVPEVSALDFANGVNIAGFLVPALSTRRAQTEVALKDGQSFAIAGLMDNRLTDVADRIPGLSHIPIIGNLFKSKAINKSNAELLVTVTPRLIQPGSTASLPSDVQFPRAFLDPNQFDGTAGQTPDKR